MAYMFCVCRRNKASSCVDQSNSVLVGVIKRTKAIKAEIAAVRIRQADNIRIEECQLGMGNVMEKPGSVAKEIIFLAVERKS